jgi:hypothetical protein
MRRSAPLLAACLAVAVAAPVLTGCQTVTQRKVYLEERFDMDDAFSRLFDANPQQTCESARRALLSQGYLLTEQAKSSNAQATQVQARKHFQPEGDVHVQIEFTVNCVADAGVTTAFVSAIQEQYALKRSSQSASVGVSAIGSVSIPVGSSGDQLVKVGSLTIPAGEFYNRFFGLMDRFLREQLSAAP